MTRTTVLPMLALALCACSGSVDFPSASHWPAAQTPPWAHQPRFAVTNNLSDTLSFVSAGAAPVQKLGDLVVGDIPVELEGPHHLAASPDGRFIYYNLSNNVPGTGAGPHGSHGTGTVPGSLVKVDAASGAKLSEVTVDRSPGDVILSADGKTAYVSHYDLLRVAAQQQAGGPPESAYSSIAVVDTDSMTRLALVPTCPAAHGEGLSADGRTLYVTCALSDQLAVVDVSDRAHPQVTLRLPVGPKAGPIGQPIYSPYALAVSPADGTVWVSNNKSGDVRVFDPRTMQMDPARHPFVNGVAMFGAFNRDGSIFYVPHQGDDKLTAIDTATLALQDLPMPTDVCLNVHAFVMAPDFASGLAVCEGDHLTRPGQVVSISLAPLVITGTTAVGMFSDGAAWLPAAP